MKTMLTFALCALLSGCGAAGAGALKGLGDGLKCAGKEMNDEDCLAQYSPPATPMPTLPPPPAPGTPGGIYMPPPPPAPYPHA
jgi:hypothetical protein